MSANIKSQQQLNLERAEFLLYQALDQDEAENIDEAVMLYSLAIELCINTSVRLNYLHLWLIITALNPKSKHLNWFPYFESTSCDAAIAEKLRQLAKKALDRAEVLKVQEKLRKSPSLELPEPLVDGMFFYFVIISMSIYYCFFIYGKLSEVFFDHNMKILFQIKKSSFILTYVIFKCVSSFY